MLEALAESLCGVWSEALQAHDVILRPPLRLLKAGSLNGAGRKVCFFVFGDRQARPKVVIKHARDEADQARLRYEHEALARVAAVPAVGATVPRPVGQFAWRGGLVTVETCLPGVPLRVLWHRGQRVRAAEAARALDAGQSWLARLQGATHSGYTPFRGADRFGAEPALRADFMDELRSVAKTWTGHPLPLVVRHGDFWPGNWLVTRDGCGVIDWEHSSVGTGWTDGFMFLVTLTQVFPWTASSAENKLEAFRRAFLQPGALTEAARAYTACLLHAQGLPPEAAHLFFSLFLIDMAGASPQPRPGQPRPQAWWPTLLELYSTERRRSIFG